MIWCRVRHGSLATSCRGRVGWYRGTLGHGKLIAATFWNGSLVSLCLKTLYLALVLVPWHHVGRGLARRSAIGRSAHEFSLVWMSRIG